MARKICNGCGGYVGVDCFNPIECEWIAMDQQRIRRENDDLRLRRLEDENARLHQRLLELEHKQHENTGRN